jgi:hypothetical protein
MCADSHRASLSEKTRRDTRAFGELDNLIYLPCSRGGTNTRQDPEKYFGERTRSGRNYPAGMLRSPERYLSACFSGPKPCSGRRITQMETKRM